MLFISPDLARLRPDVEQRRLAGIHDRHRLLQRRPKLGRVLDRPFPHQPIDRARSWYSMSGFMMLVPIGPMSLPRLATRFAEARQPLHMHQLLMVAAVVVHHGEQSGILCRARRPQYARGVHQVAVALDRDRESARRYRDWQARPTDRGCDSVADAGAARAAEPMIVLLHRPQPKRPAADVADSETIDQSRSLIAAQSSMESRAVLIGSRPRRWRRPANCERALRPWPFAQPLRVFRLPPCDRSELRPSPRRSMTAASPRHPPPSICRPTGSAWKS